jgi:glycosyltransferase involved in cell wall biosynthesis
VDGISIVIPTVGRGSLHELLEALQVQLSGDLSGDDVEVVVVQDTDHRGPAATRNTGWRKARYDWVCFLDDDVIPLPGWFADLKRDLDVPPHVGGVQGKVHVPLPADRRPTDWERCTGGLESASWITADMAYRREALAAVGGFDERFPRAYREDADLAYRVRLAGYSLLRGRRRVLHPVRPEGRWISLRTQRGNADDAYLRHKYGPRWRRLLEVPPGRRGSHAVLTALAAATIFSLGVRPLRPASVVFGLSWLAGTAEFALRRIEPGPRTGREVGTMLVTSALIPPLAVFHWVRGWLGYAATASGSRTDSTIAAR